MKTATRILGACAILVLMAAPVMAQDPLTKRVSLDLKAVAAADAFQTLATSVGLKVAVDPGVTAPVDILVRNVTARTALTTMCESIGCAWSYSGGTLSIKQAGTRDTGPAFIAVDTSGAGSKSIAASRIMTLLRQPLPADMKFENTPIDQVSDRISKALGTKVVLSSTDPAHQRLTMDLSGKSLEAGLRELSTSGSGNYRLGLKIETDPSGKTVSPTIMISVSKPADSKKK